MGGVAELLAEARADGIELRADGDRLLVTGPRRCEALVRRLVEAKADVLLHLRAECDPKPSDERPAEDLASIIRRSITEPFPGVDAWVPCLGGCGTLVGAGQKCRPCAEKAVDEWIARRKRPGRLTGLHVRAHVGHTRAAEIGLAMRASPVAVASKSGTDGDGLDEAELWDDTG